MKAAWLLISGRFEREQADGVMRQACLVRLVACQAREGGIWGWLTSSWGVVAGVSRCSRLFVWRATQRGIFLSKGLEEVLGYAIGDTVYVVERDARCLCCMTPAVPSVPKARGQAHGWRCLFVCQNCMFVQCLASFTIQHPPGQAVFCALRLIALQLPHGATATPARHLLLLNRQ